VTAVDDGTATTTALRTLAQDTTRRPLLVALDFDGTLAPLVDDPDASRALPAAVEALRALADVPAVTLALVSGRSLTDLHRRAEVPVGTVLIGSHGAERGHVGEHGLVHDPVELTPEQDALLVQVGAGLQRAARGRDGVWVQHKPAAAVLHTRMAEPDDAEAATTEGLAVAEGLGVDALHGKDVVEVSVLTVTKGRALTLLREELGARAAVYAGDDTTDEHAFADLPPQDVTVKVGPGTTVARYRVADPEALADALARFAAELEDRDPDD
jgi:trehalose 6-phosphate phosphatase